MTQLTQMSELVALAILASGVDMSCMVTEDGTAYLLDRPSKLESGQSVGLMPDDEAANLPTV